MISNILGGRKMIPVVEKMEVFPVAGHDCMELNLSGAHAPYFTRNIVILTDSNGVEGVGEVPGGEEITNRRSTRFVNGWMKISKMTCVAYRHSTFVPEYM